MRVRPEKKLEKEGRENLDFLCVFGKKKEANTIYYKWLFGKKRTHFHSFQLIRRSLGMQAMVSAAIIGGENP